MASISSTLQTQITAELGAFRAWMTAHPVLTHAIAIGAAVLVTLVVVGKIL